MEDRRKGKLHYYLQQILQGKDGIQTSPKAKRFLDAICSESDPVACIGNILSSKHGVLAVQQSMRIDVTTSFINSSVCDFLQYLRGPDVAAACGGDLLQALLQHIVDPPIFWQFFCNYAESGSLSSLTLESFAWLLLRLLSDPNLDATPFIAIASNTRLQQVLSNTERPETRNIWQKIQQTLRNLITHVPAGVDGPGGRHDNDFADFRKIALLPTIDELISSDPPYLRFASEIETACDEDRLNAHLDNQFRLLREDMICDMKEELTGQSKRNIRRIDGLELVGVDYDSSHMWALEFACTKGLFFLNKQKDTNHRQEYLKKHPKILAHDSVVCVFAAGKVVGFGTIWRRVDKLSEDIPLLHIHLPNNQAVLCRTLKDIRDSSQVEILSLQTAMFAYEPILLQLQNAQNLDLAESLMKWSPTQIIPQITASENLRSVVHMLRSDHSTELRHLLRLSKPVTLDQSQASSLIAGITQQITLIQGPPGTGKSFIGALVAKALHLHTSHKILVLSYTNHALDEYLKDLINIGIPPADIVRLGSFFKASTATKPLLLGEKTVSTGYTLKRDDWNLHDFYKTQATDIGERLKTSFAEYAETKAKRGEIMDYLEFSDEFQDYFDAFQLSQDGAFKTVDSKGKAAGPYYLLDCWMRNDKVHGSVSSLTDYPHIWASSSEERGALRRRWLDDILGERLQRLIDYGKQYNSKVLAASKVKGENGRRLLQDMRVIGCTTTAAAKMVSEIQSVRPEIVIVEEAGEILESHILAALGPETKQLILIGDHKQLRPKSHYSLSVEKGTGYDLNRSLFERLVLKGYPHEKLSQQHRMRPEISTLVRKLTYPELTDAPGTQGRAPMRGFEDNIVFLDHAALETEGTQAYDPREGGTSSSKTNDFEAQMTLKCVKYLALQGYRSDQIVVLTPYLGQLRLLFDVLQSDNDPVLNDLDSHDLVRAGLMPAATANASKTPLRISTIDNYQGEESDIVIASLTRSNKRGDIGFMSSPERLNVLISRARDGIIFVGNSETFLNARNGKQVWSNFLGLLRDEHHIYDGLPVRCERHPMKKASLATVEDFDKFCPDGGCDAPCGAILNCGVHSCPSKCHQLYDHSKMKCKTIIADRCTNGHKLSWECSDERPASCRPCDAKKKREDEKTLVEHEQLVAEAVITTEHEAKIADLDAKIELERQRLKCLSIREDQERAVKQKLSDLHKARENVEKAKQIEKRVYAKQAPDGLQVEHIKNAASVEKPSSAPAQQSTKAAQQHNKSVPLPLPSQAAQTWTSMKSFEGVTNNVIDELMCMTGLESVKAWTLQILQRLQTAQRQGVDIKKERLGTVLLGNPGTGKTTVARLLAEFFEEIGVIPSAGFVETTGSKLANDGVASAKKMLDDLLQKGGGVIFIDEAYQLVSGNSYGGGAVLDFLLAEIENTVGKLIFMFAGYEKQMEKFFQHNPGLPSRMPHQLKFGDYSESELLHMLGKKIEKKFHDRMQVEGGRSGLYMRIAVRRLHRLSGQPGFGNARALENLLAKITSAQSIRLGRERLLGLRPDDFFLCKEDIIGVEPSGALLNSTAWQKLRSMIGLDSVKSSVEILLQRLVDNYKRELEEQPILEVSLNRLCLGSPGTGKTTVAKLYGQILAEIGLLSSSECVVKTPADFIGSVMGESEKNTKGILDNSKGKVLVIDEAYMLSSASGDIYRTAVIDTIVSEVHSVPGDDRAVLLLGYEEQMKEMLRKSNPGLARRFPIENAFMFEDYNDEQLLAILNHKLTAQGLDADAAAKRTAIDLLGKLRRRPNFGNAGEVENLLTRAKDNYSRRPKTVVEESSDRIVFQPQDFDPNVGRNVNAVQDCKTLFKDVVGSEELVDKLTGYVQSFINANEIGIDPVDVLPFNFVFKGPPGTGKTTTARKIGTVFYSMGFLGSDDVVECSATDLIGEYVGQTGPKVVGKFDEAVGQVLFVDEAYRLGEGPFAKEAVDEVVDCLTKDKYKGKMLVIFAGYEEQINYLLKVNPGLSSRFPEEVMFHHLTPTLCMELLLKKLQKNNKLTLELDLTSAQKTISTERFQQLSQLSGWANGRDIETVASRIVATVLRTPKSADKKLRVTWSNVTTELDRMYIERARRAMEATGPSLNIQSQLLQQHPGVPRAPTLTSSAQSLAFSTASVPPPALPQSEDSAKPEATNMRDDGVSDATWQQLQIDQDHRQKAEAALEEAINKAEVEKANLAQLSTQATANAAALEKQAAVNDEARRRWEAARLKAVKAKRQADEEALRLKKLMEERQQEQKAQQKLRQMGVCVAGYRWIKQQNGYRCAGGSHFVGNSQLGL